VRKGEKEMSYWIIEDHGFGGTTYRCSDCGDCWNDIFADYSMGNSCPNCGARINEDAVYKESPTEKKSNSWDHDLLKKFVEYLKNHSCMYDYDTTGHYCSFRAVDVDDMDELLEEFMEEGKA
jgi:DNA-directed RNA polymerase subunit RPC12/RpoP